MTGPAPAPAQAPPTGSGRLSAVLHNKPLMIAGAGAVGLGLFAAYRRKKTGGPSTSGGTADGVAYGTPANPAQLNTIGTDVASTLGQFGQAQSQDLNAWLANLTDTLTQAGQIPTEGPNPGPGPGPGAGTFAFAAANQNLYELGDLNQLRALNPNLNNLILWADPTPAHPFLTPHLQTGMNLRVA